MLTILIKLSAKEIFLYLNSTKKYVIIFLINSFPANLVNTSTNYLLVITIVALGIEKMRKALLIAIEAEERSGNKE